MSDTQPSSGASPSFTLIYVLFLIAALLLAGFSAVVGGQVVFVPMDGGELFAFLVPLLLIAVVIERTTDLLISSWREADRAETEADLDIARESGDSGEARRLTRELRRYRANTRRYAYLVAFGAGLLIAAFGIRVLQPLTDLELAAELWTTRNVGFGLQHYGFRVIDIIVSAGLLAGGASALHHLRTFVLDAIYRSRRRSRASPLEESGDA